MMICEQRPLERDLARDWWELAPQTMLLLEDGRRCLLLAKGQPGGPAGPDVRDAVLLLLPRLADEEGTRLVGDVEFHIWASDWFAHGHHTDPRYNGVMLHVVRYPDTRNTPTRRQDGSLVPLCSLLDLPRAPIWSVPWPCQARPLEAHELTTTLLRAGLQRFHGKSRRLRETLETEFAWRRTGAGAGGCLVSSPGCGSLTALHSEDHNGARDKLFSAYDTCLLPALAEGLGYGRDRAFFRAAGLRLVGLPVKVPEPLGHTQGPAPLDAHRLSILLTLSARWRKSGAWQSLRRPLLAENDVKATALALRAALHPLSRARADILIANIVLPFAAAVADIENDPHLAARAQQTYLAYPGLASNRITRGMSLQLQLTQEPRQACLQQGLQHIYASACQAKQCQGCPCGGQRL